jgi:Reverse transcriptase (RNA-dependent DNA polymerase)
MFAIFIDDVVDTVRRTNVGCSVHFICCAIFLYADDIVLLKPSVTGLQLLLTTCERYLSEIGVNINVSKSTCIKFGPRFSNVCEICDFAMANNWTGAWVVNNWVYILSAQLPSEFRLISLKVIFFRSWNAIFSRVERLASEEVVISLLRQKCLPILLYGTESCPLFSRDKHSF